MTTNYPTKLEAVDVFCGVGGLTHGLERAGFSVRLGVDIDESCRYPFEANNSGKFLCADVSELASSTVADAYSPGALRLLAGCAPCQPFSTYSRKAVRKSSDRLGRGKDDDWRLVIKFGELIKRTKPDLITMENVPPLVQQPVFQSFLNMLEGYHVDWKIVQCRKIGLPQTRTRLVLVASRLGEISIPDFDEEKRSVKDAISCLPSIKAGEVSKNDPLHRSSRLSALNMKRIVASVPGGTWRDWPDELRADCHKLESGATYPAVYGRMEWDAPAPTITTQCFGYGNGRFGHPEQDRAISLREAAILQGFPEGYKFLRPGESASFSTLGRLIGNAVPVTLGEVIGGVLRNHAVQHMQRLEIPNERTEYV